ncbi:kif19 [Symbiodinium necroappetens]|uniref:Kif19 protein n=1 Tax=Symbiodinium necroappetens TaxID=1628268 RepID=A0A812J5A2_9DINO|nr:kif19 [Symbiodinium necroappetens]
MVECTEQIKPAAKFSGSTHCGNSHYVLSVAQAQEGRLVAMKLLVHAFAGPLLALLADSMGRRPILLLGLTGFLTAFLLFALVALLPSLHGSSGAISLCFFLEGATSAFDVVFLSMLADTAKSPAARVTSFSLYYATGAFGNAIAIGIFVEEMSWEVRDFGLTWASMSLAMAMLILYVLAYVPETLPSAMLLKSKHSKLKAPHVQLMGQAIEQIQFLASSRFLQIWLLAVLFKSLASGLSSINASFTLAVYGWNPGEWQAWIWPSEIISMSSLGILGPWAGRKKAESVISVTALVSVAAHVLQMLAPFHALALLGPHFIAGLLAFVRPVSAAYLSGRFPASQQAKVQAIAHLSHNCGISLSMAIFSSPQLFRHLVWLLFASAFLKHSSCVFIGEPGRRALLLNLGLWLPLPAQAAFENALPEIAKFPDKRTPGNKPDDLGLQPRTLNRFGDKSDGPVLKGCGYGPNCFSTTGDPEDPQITTLLQPWKIPDGASVADASAQLEETVRAYPPGQQKVDGGGFQVVKAGSDGYLYAQFESLKKGKIDDVEFAINKDGTVQVRSSGRIGLKADYGSNAKRLNYISEQLRAKGWTAPVITNLGSPKRSPCSRFSWPKRHSTATRSRGQRSIEKLRNVNFPRHNALSSRLSQYTPLIAPPCYTPRKDTHAYYFAMNSGKTKFQCVGIDCPVNYELIEEEPGPGESE